MAKEPAVPVIDLAQSIGEKLREAVAVAKDCGEPDKISMFDEEGVEGWRWTSSDGRTEWTEIGDWSEEPSHPIVVEAMDFARTKLTE